MEKGDFTLYEKKGNIYSMGMKFKNILRSSGLPAMVGGSKTNRNELGIPVGITLIKSHTGGFNEENSLKGGVVKGDLYDKLLNMCGGKQKTNAKSKKRGRKKNKKKKNKTRKI